ARLDGNLVVDEVTSVGGGTLQRIDTAAGGGYVVEWPDGTIMHVDPYVLANLTVTVTPSPSRAGKLKGLFGDDDGHPENDIATSDGQDLGTAPSRDAFNTTFTDSWRVTPATSLFDYGPGQSTDTFTDKTFPHSNVDASNAPNRATAEQQCRAEGITDK